MQILVASLVAQGRTGVEVCAEAGISAATLQRWRHATWWPGLLTREVDAQRHEAERLLSMARPGAVRALQAACDGGDADAAKALLMASQPPSERQRAQARADLLRALKPATAALVAKELAGQDENWLRGLTDEELERMLAGDQ